MLIRFKHAVAKGRIRGPIAMKNPWSKLPQYRWEVTRLSDIEAVVELLWRWLDAPKRRQAREAFARYRSLPTLRELREQAHQPV